MKNYIIGVLGVVILVFASIIYKEKLSPRNSFPLPEETSSFETKASLILFVFFSKNNCPDCLEIIDVLNQLPSHFVVFGIVPENELKDEKELRRITKAAFPLLSVSRYREHITWYAPTIVGVSPVNGDIFFTLPGVPGEKAYLGIFLESLYNKVSPVFLKEKGSISNL
ncbi:MAG: hypothetical protein NT166_01910 [Candidatus Aminicenantes bacterium]|nr:hypothetical protein [Candidatus Aminicenantes bacterium]